jgi:transposase InsO family protein
MSDEVPPGSWRQGGDLRHPDAALACAGIEMAIAVRGGRQAITGVVFHTDRGSTYTADALTTLCRDSGTRQSMGRVGSCFDKAAAEAFFSTLEWEVLSRHEFTDPDHTQRVVAEWCLEFYNTQRRHSSAAMMTPSRSRPPPPSSRRRHKEPFTIWGNLMTKWPRRTLWACGGPVSGSE